jgi:3-hydroxyacyl-CoA dehydrogenase/enoyl-CoA hydratase/3-hydroxybutyryl-CoA epimerase
VPAGQLGHKSGHGFCRYNDGKPVRRARATDTDDPAKLEERLISKLIDEATACLHEGVVEDADLLDAIIVFGIGFAPFRGGLLHYRAVRQRDATQQAVGHD